MHKPYSRWTADTQTAFLMALKATGQARTAAEAIGRSLSTAYRRRRRHPEFRARWDAAVAEQQEAWIGVQDVEVEPVPPGEARGRFDGWTRLRRRTFLRALSETGRVKDACERVGISDTSVYRLRQRSAVFARDFAAALERSLPMIEQVAWERAVDGWEEPVVVRGEVVGTRRRYSESLLRMLLGEAQKARRAEAAAEAKALPRGMRRATPEETDAQLGKQLDALARRLRAEDRVKRLAQAEAWERMQRETGGGDGDGWVRAPRG
jgi:uncharacterized protein YecT (DUF1311 family)